MLITVRVGLGYGQNGDGGGGGLVAWVYPEDVVRGRGLCPLFGRSEVEGKAFMETFLSAACLSIIKNFCC